MALLELEILRTLRTAKPLSTGSGSDGSGRRPQSRLTSANRTTLSRSIAERAHWQRPTWIAVEGRHIVLQALIEIDDVVRELKRKQTAAATAFFTSEAIGSLKLFCRTDLRLFGAVYGGVATRLGPRSTPVLSSNVLRWNVLDI